MTRGEGGLPAPHKRREPPGCALPSFHCVSVASGSIHPRPGIPTCCYHECQVAILKNAISFAPIALPDGNILRTFMGCASSISVSVLYASGFMLARAPRPLDSSCASTTLHPIAAPLCQSWAKAFFGSCFPAAPVVRFLPHVLFLHFALPFRVQASTVGGNPQIEFWQHD